jgi:hypothetical protein
MAIADIIDKVGEFCFTMGLTFYKQEIRRILGASCVFNSYSTNIGGPCQRGRRPNSLEIRFYFYTPMISSDKFVCYLR